MVAKMTDPEEPGDKLGSPEFDRSRLVFDVWLGFHKLEEDYETLEPLLRRGGYDIYIPEAADRTPLIEDTFRKFARGDRKFYEAAMSHPSPYKLIARGLFATHINIFLPILLLNALIQTQFINLLERVPF